MQGLLRTHWFPIGLLVILLLSWVLPAPVRDSTWPAPLKLSLIAAIFFISGLSLRTSELASGLSHWRLHSLVQFCSLVLPPLVMLAVMPLLTAAGMSSELQLGFFVLAALPTTVTSCVALTTAAGGNTAGALVNASLGNMLGVVVTPLWLYGYVGSAESVPLSTILIKLGSIVVAPVIIGQLLQRPLTAFVQQWRKQLNKGSLLLLLGIIFLSFNRAFADGIQVSWGLVGIALLCCFILHALWILSPWLLARIPQLACTPSDRICATICGSQKTLAFGIPLIAVFFSGSPHIPVISLPILLYHPLQLFIAGGLIPLLRKLLPDELPR